MGTTVSRTFSLFLIVASSLAGCRPQTRTVAGGPITLDPTGEIGADVVFERMDYSGLATVLKAAVRRGGKVVAERLKQESNTLESQLIQMSVVGPEATPELFADDEQRLAYWYNARAAWALRLLTTFSRERLEGETQGSGGKDKRDREPETVSADEFYRRPFPLDGRMMTLAGVDLLLEGKFGWKAAVAAPCVIQNRAALPLEPFEAKDSDELIGKRFNEFIDDPDRCVIDVMEMRIMIPPILWRFRGRIMENHRKTYLAEGATLATALLPHTKLSAHRRLQDAIGYECVEAPKGSAELLEELEDD